VSLADRIYVQKFADPLQDRLQPQARGGRQHRLAPGMIAVIAVWGGAAVPADTEAAPMSGAADGGG
jgi:hypothetical protein